MAISLEPFERQFLDFADAIRNHRKPLVGAGEEGCDALEIVERIYDCLPSAVSISQRS
jgi:predicted dehydrogenase